MTKDREKDAAAAAATGPEELAEVEWLADLGEIVGPVTYEFNNFLNTLLLQVAVLDLSAPEGLKAELAAIRRHGREVAQSPLATSDSNRRSHSNLVKNLPPVAA